jgi:TM2 domain-containing membrane protein YozV
MQTPAAEQPNQQYLLDDLYNYPLRSYNAALAWWLLSGFVGGHRYYLNDVRRGLLQTLTLGGGLVWWVADLINLRKLVNNYNGRQMYRRTHRQPPVELDFLPTLDAGQLQAPAPWMQTSAATGTLGKELLVLFVLGLAVGKVCQRMETFEPLVGLGVLSLLLLGAGWLLPLVHLRLVQELLQWDLKLQLYYHANGPGSVGERLWRPLVGLFTLPFQEKRAAEARLYIDICIVVSLFFVAYSLLTGEYLGLLLQRNFAVAIIAWFKDSALSFFLVYTCVSPLGATLIKYKLLGTRQWDALLLVAAMAAGIWVALG